MNADYTHIAMIIDRSGSMSFCWEDVTGGYSEIVKTNKEAPGKCTFTVAAFDTEYDLLEDFTDIQSVKDTLTVSPRGGTALLDAIGKTVVSVGEKLAKLPEAERPGKILVVVQTDGDENSSKEFTAAAVKALIEEQTSKYNWQFQFMGATQSSITEATSRWGFSASNASTYNTNNSKSAFATLGSKMAMSRCASMENYAATVCFSADEKDLLNSEKKVDTVS